MKLLRNSLFALAALSLVACGGSDDKGGNSNPAGAGGDNGAGGGGNGTCDPNDPKIPCFVGKAEMCKNYKTQFDGDEYCLEAPDPSVGFQIHVGPKDYTDPAETDRYMIAAGDETNWAEVVQLDLPDNVYSSSYYSHMRPGSHHFILFSLPPDSATQVTNGPQANTGSGTESAVGALDGEFVAGATRAVQNAAFDSTYPEDQGIGREVLKNQKYAVNLHFINTGDHPLLQEIWVNFMEIPGDQVTHWVRAITWYGGLNMHIAPHSNQMLTSGPGSCTAPDDIRIMGLTAHFHANTVRESATWTPAGGSETVMFDEFNWHEPSEWIYSRAIDNAAPDRANSKSGGFTGVMEVKKGDQFYWECDVQNQTDSTLTFSNQVYTGEMCNVFGMYTSPNNSAAPWLCAFF
ncbi:MAG TPA: hypothetical protein VHE30_28720 [Polyangiaceae bacterium]|nr:hypothetical protein [Polyangiaceae bacterium]